jgi:outer membrane protein insertion porin family
MSWLQHARHAGAFIVRALVCAALLLAVHVAPTAAQRFPGDTVEVLSIRFEGVRQVPEELLRASIVTAQTQCITAALMPLCWLGQTLDRQYLDPRALASDVFRLRVFYHQRGYREASIELDTTRVPGGIHVRFRVNEGRPVLVGSVQIEGGDSIDRRLGRDLPVAVGRPFSIIEFETTRDTLIARLADRGFAAADVFANYDIGAEDRYRADVSFTLVPGPLMRFGTITVEGADRIGPRVVQRMLMFEHGDIYSRHALLQSQRNLFSLELFRHAEIITAAPAPGDSVLPVTIRVIEGDLNRVRVGTGISTSDYISAEGRWINRNFFGRARRFEVRGRVSNLLSEQLDATPGFEDCDGIYCNIAGVLNADLSLPWFFDPLNTLAAGAVLERFTLPAVYVRTSAGGYISLRRLVGGTGFATAAWRPELTQLESDGDLIFCVNFVACEEREIDVLRDPHWLSPVAFSFAHDKSNSIFSPTAGYILRLDAEYAGGATGSDFDYIRLIGEFSFYHDPFRGVVIATRVRPGWARAVGAPGEGLGLHPQKRFFAGGPNSVRGFAQYRLGPKLLTVNAQQVLAQPVEAQGAGCSAQSINDGSCDASNLADDYPGQFEVRPVGGAVALEANVEVRFPIWRELLRGAAFVDFGQVWQGQAMATSSTLAWTPGLGVRYFSPIGPIRIDLGYNPSGAEQLTVVTTEVCDIRNPAAGCLDIQPDQVYQPNDLANRRQLRTLAPVTWRPFDSFMDRLQIHFSIGQAF